MPAAVAASLLLSLGLLALASSDGGAVREAAASATSLAAVSTAGTLGIFTRAELQRAGAPAATALAAALVALAYLVPATYAWPVQNVLCMCLAIATARWRGCCSPRRRRCRFIGVGVRRRPSIMIEHDEAHRSTFNTGASRRSGRRRIRRSLREPWSRAACPYFGPRIEQEASTRIA